MVKVKVKRLESTGWEVTATLRSYRSYRLRSGVIEVIAALGVTATLRSYRGELTRFARGSYRRTLVFRRLTTINYRALLATVFKL